MEQRYKSTGEDVVLRVGELEGWRLTHGGTRIRRDWAMNDFSSSMAFLQRVAEVAEQEGHHPDLHLEGYRNVWIEIFTHSTGGITERDLQLGARIDALARGGRVV